MKVLSVQQTMFKFDNLVTIACIIWLTKITLLKNIYHFAKIINDIDTEKLELR